MYKHGVEKLPYLLRYVPDKYKTQKMCDKPILEKGGTLKYIPDCYKNQNMCNKAVENYPPALEFVPECYKTQKMCDKTVDIYPYTIKFVPEMYYEAVNDSLGVLKLISNWSVTSKIMKKHVTALYADENMLYSNEDSLMKMIILMKKILIRLLPWHTKFEKSKELKKGIK